MRLTKKTYGEALKDPRWQKKRLEILDRDQWTCFWCGDQKTTLHVHHLYYSGTFPWETEDDGLQTLCSECHDLNHLPLSELEKSLIEIIRCRDMGQTNMVKMLNSYVNRCVKDRQNG